MPTITNKSSFEDRLAELVRILAHRFVFTSMCACIYLNPYQQEQEIELSESPAVSCMVESIRMSFVQGRRGICKFRSWNCSWMCQFLNLPGSYLRHYLGNLVQHCYFLVLHELWQGGFQTFSVIIKSWAGKIKVGWHWGQISASWNRSTAQFWRSMNCFLTAN